MICECGVDHHADAHADVEAAEAIGDAIEAAAETEAEAEHERIEAVTERNADDNDTAERIAEIHADAAVQIAEAEAEAAVAIAEAETDAIVAIADADREDEPSNEDESDDELADELPAGGAEDGAPPAGTTVTAVSVPPQLDEEAPAAGRHREARRSVSAFRSRRPR